MSESSNRTPSWRENGRAESANPVATRRGFLHRASTSQGEWRTPSIIAGPEAPGLPRAATIARSLGASLFLFGAVLASDASAQLTAKAKPQRVTGAIKSAGTYHVASSSWTRSGPQAAISPDVIYNNTTAPLHIQPVGDADTTPGGFSVTDSVRLPSTSDVGDGDRYAIDGLTFAYCSGAGIGANLSATFRIDGALASCNGPAQGDCGVAVITGLPTSSTAGVVGCWVVTIDLTGASNTFSVPADGDGFFDDSMSLDNCGLSLEFAGQGADPQTGPFLAGDPNVAAFGDGTTNFGFGAGPQGTGLGQQDALWIQTAGGAAGCMNWGGYPSNPWSGLYMRMMGSVDPGVTSLRFDGLLNHALGAATLEATPVGDLRVANLGSSGMDGVRMNLAESEGAKVTLSLEPILNDPYEILVKTEVLTVGSPSPVLTSLLISATPATGTISCLPDYSSLGSPTHTMFLYLGGVLVHEESGQTGATYALPHNPIDDDITIYDIDRWVPTGSGGEGFNQYACFSLAHTPMPVVTPSGLVFTGDVIEFRPDIAPGLVDSISGYELTTTGLSSIQIKSEEVRMFGLFAQGQGDAHLDPSAGQLRVSNIGSSGLDGVSIAMPASLDGLPPGEPVTRSVNIVDLDVMHHPGAVVQMKAKDEADRKDRVSAVETGGEWLFTPDFSELGSSTYTLELYSADQLVFQQSGMSGPAVSAAGLALFYRKKTDLPDGSREVEWCILGNPSSAHSVVGGPTVIADMFTLRSEAGGVNDIKLDAMSLTAADLSTDLVITDVTLEGESGCVGTRYCSTSLNSVGAGAIICSEGSAGVAANDLVLICNGLPTSQFGIFYYGPNQIQAPFGNGFRCVGGSTNRLPILNSGPSGMLSYSLDLANTQDAPIPPAPGSVWNFQCWYRDPSGGGSSYNLSDGLSIQFVP
ncbi:MAG: hypothetical protein ACI841_003349 [Planctomycetota bacterium]|jgi:hypothetical protein